MIQLCIQCSQEGVQSVDNVCHFLTKVGLACGLCYLGCDESLCIHLNFLERDDSVWAEANRVAIDYAIKPTAFGKSNEDGFDDAGI